MPSPTSPVTLRLPALVRQRLPWLVLALGILLMGTALLGSPIQQWPEPLTAVEQAQAIPGEGQHREQLHLVAISESGTDASRGTRPRASASALGSSTPTSATPSLTFLAAATDTRLRHALESGHRYPMAPHLLIHPAHAPPQA